MLTTLSSKLRGHLLLVSVRSAFSWSDHIPRAVEADRDSTAWQGTVGRGSRVAAESRWPPADLQRRLWGRDSARGEGPRPGRKVRLWTDSTQPRWGIRYYIQNKYFIVICYNSISNLYRRNNSNIFILCKTNFKRLNNIKKKYPLFSHPPLIFIKISNPQEPATNLPHHKLILCTYLKTQSSYYLSP